LFSLSKEEVDKLKSLGTDVERLDYLQEEIEQVYFDDYAERVAELDKAWDAIHRSLTDGKLEWNNGEFPLNHVVIGGEILYDGDDYIMTLKSPEQVEKIAEEISQITVDKFRIGYNRINKSDYGMPPSDEDFEYTWEWMSNSIGFWQRAADENRFVLFTAEQ
jgi:hypothetical protein